MQLAWPPRPADDIYKADALYPTHCGVPNMQMIKDNIEMDEALGRALTSEYLQ